jgi:catechol 2,3-dioxygenase-like lactoylglutathione lyase family enzyme
MKAHWLLAFVMFSVGAACSDDDDTAVGTNANATDHDHDHAAGSSGGSAGRAGTQGTAGHAGAAATDEVTADNDPNTSYLGAAAIGVSDLDQSQEFYGKIFGLALRYELPVEGYVNERVLYFKDSKGADVVLMNYIDGKEHNYKNNPVRLVFYVSDVNATIESIRARGLDIISEPHAEATFHDAIIGIGRDPDGYMLELIEDKDLSVPYLAAIALGVSDLDQAKAFYTDTLGMSVSGDITKVPGVWDEWILEYASGNGSNLVLMHYTDGKDHNYSDLPVKSVHFVGNSRALTAKVESAGLSVISQPQVLDVLGTKALIGLTRDHDGYTLELVTTQ